VGSSPTALAFAIWKGIQMQRILKNYDSEIVNKIYETMFKNNELQIMPHNYYIDLINKHGMDIVSFIATKKALYGIPTVELVEYLKPHITSNTIEIGSGNGILAKALNIKATDNYTQEDLAVRLTYLLMLQAPVEYGENVEKIDDVAAMKKYKPDTVIGSWLSDIVNMQIGIKGIQEESIIKNAKYIFIGNKKTHQKKAILKYKHKTIDIQLVSRTGLENNVIWIWNN